MKRFAASLLLATVALFVAAPAAHADLEAYGTPYCGGIVWLLRNPEAGVLRYAASDIYHLWGPTDLPPGEDAILDSPGMIPGELYDFAAMAEREDGSFTPMVMLQARSLTEADGCEPATTTTVPPTTTTVEETTTTTTVTTVPSTTSSTGLSTTTLPAVTTTTHRQTIGPPPPTTSRPVDRPGAPLLAGSPAVATTRLLESPLMFEPAGGSMLPTTASTVRADPTVAAVAPSPTVPSGVRAAVIGAAHEPDGVSTLPMLALGGAVVLAAASVLVWGDRRDRRAAAPN